MIKQIKELIKQTLKDSGIHLFIVNPLAGAFENIEVEDSHYFQIMLSEKKLNLENQNLFFNILQEKLSKINVKIESYDSMSVFIDSRTNYLTIALNLPAGSF